jgi:uncharacterized protein
MARALARRRPQAQASVRRGSRRGDRAEGEVLILALLIAAADLLVPAAPAGHVNDYAKILSQSTQRELEALLTQHEAKTTNQVVVVTLPSLQGRDIADVTYAIGNAWRVGQKGKDNGVVFAVAPHERRMRIEVGKGLEGALTDLETHVIQDDVVKPAFIAGDFDRGVRDGSRAIVQAIQGEFTAPPHAQTQGHGSPWPALIVVIFLVVLFICFPRAGMLLLFSGIGRGGGGGGGGGGFSGGGGSFGGGGSSGSW